MFFFVDVAIVAVSSLPSSSSSAAATSSSSSSSFVVIQCAFYKYSLNAYWQSVFLTLDQINAWIVVKRYDNKHTMHNSVCITILKANVLRADSVLLVTLGVDAISVFVAVLPKVFVTDLFVYYFWRLIYTMIFSFTRCHYHHYRA